MNRTIFFAFFFLTCLFIMQFSLSQEGINKIAIRRFAPSLTLSIPQGTWKRLDFLIENQYNESLIIFYRIETPSGVEIKSYPEQYYMLNPSTEMAGNLNISVDPYLENRTFIIKFWIDSFRETENGTIRSDKFSINLNVLSNSFTPTTTTATTTATFKTISGEVPIEVLTTVYTTEIPTILPPGVPEWDVSIREYVLIFVVLILFLVLPLLILTKLSKQKKSTSSPEAAQE